MVVDLLGQLFGDEAGVFDFWFAIVFGFIIPSPPYLTGSPITICSRSVSRLPVIAGMNLLNIASSNGANKWSMS